MNEFQKSFVQCIPENAVVAIVRFDGYEFHKLVSGSIRCFSSDGVEQKTLTVIRQLTERFGLGLTIQKQTTTHDAAKQLFDYIKEITQ